MEGNTQGYLNSIRNAHVAKQKENTAHQGLDINKRTSIKGIQENTEDIPSERTVLRSKSANGLKVQSKGFLSNQSAQYKQKNGKNESSNDQLFGNANKARKIIKQNFPLFGTIGKNDKEKEKNERISHHDSTTLQRSQLQTENVNKNTLSRSSSAFSSSFNSSFGITTNSKPTRKIKSQLTLKANSDMSEFFKKSKEQEHKQLGIIEVEQEKVTNNNKNSQVNLEEVTFEDETEDIVSMKKMLTNRESPSYSRTRKVSLHSILSSNDSDYTEENTFDYNEKKDLGIKSKTNNLENLIVTRPLASKRSSTDDDLEIEFVSHNTNGVYDDNIPDIVSEGYHQSLTKEVLTNLWDHPTLTSIEAAEKFEDPLNLKQSWKKTDENIFELSLNEIQKPEELQLEFSDIEEDNELEIIEVVNKDCDIQEKEIMEQDEENKNSFDEEIIDLMNFYRR
jgi:hypothetical protein